MNSLLSEELVKIDRIAVVCHYNSIHAIILGTLPTFKSPVFPVAIHPHQPQQVKVRIHRLARYLLAHDSTHLLFQQAQTISEHHQIMAFNTRRLCGTILDPMVYDHKGRKYKVRTEYTLWQPTQNICRWVWKPWHRQ